MTSRIEIVLQVLSVIALALPALMILADSLGIKRADTSSDAELELSMSALRAFFILLIALVLICAYIVLYLLNIDIIPGPFSEVILIVIFGGAFAPLLRQIWKYVSE